MRISSALTGSRLSFPFNQTGFRNRLGQLGYFDFNNRHFFFLRILYKATLELFRLNKAFKASESVFHQFFKLLGVLAGIATAGEDEAGRPA